jgi:RNA-directed DNA polymerase
MGAGIAMKSGNADGVKAPTTLERERRNIRPMQGGENRVDTNLTRIRDKARAEPKLCFTSLYHHVTDAEHLLTCYGKIEAGKAPGIDGVSKEEYGKDLEVKLEDLSARLRRMGYRPQAVRRVYIPKIGSKKQRPLGIPCFEDQVVQMAVKRVLEQIYEADFLECSYGYRPGRTPHQALDRLGRTIQQQKISYIVEADIRSFFDRVHHEWLEKFLGVRIGDERVLRLIRRMLKSGIMEDGLRKPSEEGTPQGGVLSPLLSNIYLHYVLDLWFERKFKRQCRGEAYLFRYADDYLACFQYREEAERFLREMTARLAQFHLEVEPSKTKLVPFGRFARKDAEQRGLQPGEFDFLGFTHYCGQTRHGCFKVQRRTSKKKFRAKLKEMKEWLKQQRSRLRKGELLRQAKRRLQGHLQYYAITDNGRMCDAFRRQVSKLLFKWMNRQSQRRSYDLERFQDALAWVGWPSVRIVHRLDPFRSVGLK